jgi:hypothetical protein
MEECRALAAIYPPENVLNIDKTDLFWKLSPSRTLATEAGSGGKKSKDRITVALTVNATGTDKWKPYGLWENRRVLVALRILIVDYLEFNIGTTTPNR